MFALKFIVLLSVVALSFGAPASRHTQDMRDVSQFCQDKHASGVPVGQIFKLESADVPENLKCFIKCTYDKSGIISEGALDRDTYNNIMKTYTSDDIIKQIGDFCLKDVGDLSKCSTAYEIQKCSIVKLRELDPSAFGR